MKLLSDEAEEVVHISPFGASLHMEQLKETIEVL